jgi:hypothetical protein
MKTIFFAIFKPDGHYGYPEAVLSGSYQEPLSHTELFRLYGESACSVYNWESPDEMERSYDDEWKGVEEEDPKWFYEYGWTLAYDCTFVLRGLTGKMAAFKSALDESLVDSKTGGSFYGDGIIEGIVSRKLGGEIGVIGHLPKEVAKNIYPAALNLVGEALRDTKLVNRDAAENIIINTNSDWCETLKEPLLSRGDFTEEDFYDLVEASKVLKLSKEAR